MTDSDCLASPVLQRDLSCKGLRIASCRRPDSSIQSLSWLVPGLFLPLIEQVVEFTFGVGGYDSFLSPALVYSSRFEVKTTAFKRSDLSTMLLGA